jgi:hypothetical protein
LGRCARGRAASRQPVIEIGPSVGGLVSAAVRVAHGSSSNRRT